MPRRSHSLNHAQAILHAVIATGGPFARRPHEVSEQQTFGTSLDLTPQGDLPCHECMRAPALAPAAKEIFYMFDIIWLDENIIFNVLYRKIVISNKI